MRKDGNRNAAIELFRILMMFGICWLHCCQQGGHASETGIIYNSLLVCVPGFILISGYFGIRFTWNKVLRLCGVCAWGAAVSLLLRYAILDSDGNIMADFCYAIVTGYWFLWAYVALMMFSPVLNIATEGDHHSVNSRVVPLLILVFGWSFACNLPLVRHVLPTTRGLSPLSFITLAGIYVVARVYRAREWEVQLNYKFFILFAFSMVANAVGFGVGAYNSISALVVAFGLFYFVKKIHLPEKIGKVVSFISPSVFSIYILHQTRKGFDFIGVAMGWVDKIIPSPLVGTFVAAVCVFVLCVSIDLVRRGVYFAIEKVFK